MIPEPKYCTHCYKLVYGHEGWTAISEASTGFILEVSCCEC